MDYNARKEALVSLIYSYAPEESKSVKVWEKIKEYESAEYSETIVLTTLASILYNGMVYGNWPWLEAKNRKS